MFLASTEESVKNSIVKTFTQPNSPMQVIIATITFRMELDAPDVRHIIQFGPFESIEAYIQETGHCRSDG